MADTAMVAPVNRVQRGFAFIDLCGFTSFTDVHGDADAVAVLATFRTAVREISSRRGVRVAKWLGDGAMFVGVEIEPLVAAVMEIESRVADTRSPLALRAGLASGQVILFEGDDYIGSPVNLAARLCDAATGGETLATEPVAAAAPPWVTCAPAGARAIPGFLRPVELVDLMVREEGASSVEDPVCRMMLPADAVAATRLGPEGTVCFCSESCAELWETTNPVA